MTTAERANILEQVLSDHGAHWQPSARELIESVALELSQPEALDRWIPYGNQQSRARCLSPILHIMSRNTPEAAIQSIGRGILLGAQQQWVKLPSGGLPELETFLETLPQQIKDRITCSRELLPDWVESAKAVIAFGSEETLAEIHQQLRHDQVFQSHGHKLSCAVMFEYPSPETIKQLVEQVAIYDQLGCLSPHQLFLGPNLRDQGPALAAALADEFTKFEESKPRTPVPSSVALQIQHQRNLARLDAAIDPEHRMLFESANSTSWTVVFDSNSTLRSGPGHRFLRISPLPVQVSELGAEMHFLSTVGVYPANEDSFENLSDWQAPRLCPIPEMQHPGPFWHHDGRGCLADLVIWQDRVNQA